MLTINFDDVSLDNEKASGLNWLFYLKGKFPAFKANLFVIPNRSTWAWIKELNKIKWLELGMHGWDHDEKQSIEGHHLDEWIDHGLPKIYKGPGWKVSPTEYAKLERKEFIICTKSPLGMTNIPYFKNHYVEGNEYAFHGHVWNPTDFEVLEKKLNPERTFAFISEAVK